MKLSHDQLTCDDIDECSHDGDELCGDLECHNTYGGYKCLCGDGKEPDEEGECDDGNPNPCENNGGCSQLSSLFINF